MAIIMLVVIDQAIKYFVVQNRPFCTLIPKWLEVCYAENTGTVFGFARGQNSVLLFLAIFILFVLFLVLFLKMKEGEKVYFAWELVFAGGVSNIIDRIARGFVVDYLYIRPFGVCNLADFLIVIGVVILGIKYLKIRSADEEDN